MLDSIVETPSLLWQIAQALRLRGILTAGALEKYWSVSYSELEEHQLAWCCEDASGALCRHAKWAENRKRQLPCKLLLSARHDLQKEAAGLVGIACSRCYFHADLRSQNGRN